MPNLYIIAGCNGAGKTTASYTVLPEILNCKEFINADEIAKGLSPFQPETVSIQAGRIMLNRINELLNSKASFAFETTLSSKSYVNTVKEAQEAGYIVSLVYFWLNTVDLAIERVGIRVKEGGHNIPEDIVRRRYKLGIRNLFERFIPIVNYWMVFDNSRDSSVLIAEGDKSESSTIYNESIWNEIKSIANGR
ncbi:MAG: zeta toxin family protein [Sporocytophaga sp.]|jgi:predicted ABC-type ATPase|nr:zeta toxin family protein [Sporocytophaga sp.]